MPKHEMQVIPSSVEGYWIVVFYTWRNFWKKRGMMAVIYPRKDQPFLYSRVQDAQRS